MHLNNVKTRAKFEPEDGKTLLIVGQDKGEMDAYVNQVGKTAGFMVYTSLSGLKGMTSSYRGPGVLDGGEMDFQHWVNDYPDTCMQLGLCITDELDNINCGRWDNNIDTLAHIIKAAERPVFLRIGYEVEPPWNHFDPAKFKVAWIRIVERFRSRKADNVAFVWHCAAYSTWDANNSGSNEDDLFSDWYPGDDYVDWIAISWFSWSNDTQMDIGAGPNEIDIAPQYPSAATSSAVQEQAHNEYIAFNARASITQFAKEHNKPLMIAESAPRAYWSANNSPSLLDPSRTNAEIAWDHWYSLLFKFILKYDVKAFCYINQDWDAQGMWAAQPGWGDSRVQSNENIKANWLQSLSDSRYITSFPGK